MNDQTSYNNFLAEHRISINRTLNKVLWVCIIIGPSIALGIALGSFPNTSYGACLIISAATLFLAIIHTLLLKKWPESPYTSHFIFLALNLLLVQMNHSKIYIQITWFFVPMLSILFCSTKFYLCCVVINYLLMSLSVYLMSPYYSAVRSDYATTKEYFFNVFGGYTIETLIMALAGYIICHYITMFLTHILHENTTIRDNKQELENQLKIQVSMAKIYDTVNLIDFDKMTEKSLSDLDSTEYSVEGHAHSRMNHMIRKKVIPEQYDAFTEFTDITTLRERLTGEKSVSAEFIHIDTGWFRAQYISLEDDISVPPTRIIYTTQTIEDTKKREQDLIRISTTDELTGLYNRRSFDNDLKKYETQSMEGDLVIISIDVNGLKEVNDTKGHTAGDELIKGAAECIFWAVCSVGKVYRIGGDEFLAAINSDNPKRVLENIRSNIGKWHGNQVEALSISMGYAAHKDYPIASLSELEQIADEFMYKDKAEYYRTSGKDRRTR